ncbi:MAG TPA: hypothetical protein VK501_16130 [Baekduia sp.]|uniref:hypothetical protein n=1 Tax=Baekduia sp. TaxID=2600305 RepID=UPI002B637362|nr:hypothetical protein [Baekduia sp.]HMJ35437.1 hypothetical protein [Baekduia sp.]
MNGFAAALTVLWLLLAALFLLQAKRLEEDPSKATDGTPPHRWRILGFVMLGIASINVVALVIA